MGVQLGWMVTKHLRSPLVTHCHSCLGTLIPKQPLSRTATLLTLWCIRADSSCFRAICSSRASCWSLCHVQVCYVLWLLDVIPLWYVGITRQKAYPCDSPCVRIHTGMKYRCFTFFGKFLHASLRFYNKTCFLKFSFSS